MSKGGAWRSVAIGELIERVEAGVSVRAGDTAARDGEAGVLKTSALSDGVFDHTQNKRILDAEFYRAAVNPIAGCTLMSRMNTLKLVGESAFVESDYPTLFLPDRIWQLHPKRELVDPYWLSLALAYGTVRKTLQAVASGTSGSMKNISQPQLRALRVALPSLETQSRISRVGRKFASLRKQLTAHIAATSALKGALTDGLLAGQLRFREGRSPKWKVVRLGNHLVELTERNRGRLSVSSVMGVVKNLGLTPMKDHVRASSIDRYLIVPPNGFAYNPMRLNIGSIARNQFGNDCLVSPDYVVFKTDDAELLPSFLDQVRRSHVWQRFVRPAGLGSVRIRIYFDDLAEMRIPLPPVAEQKRIANVLETCDREIALLHLQLDAYAHQQRALLQRLLSGDLPDLDPAA